MVTVLPSARTVSQPRRRPPRLPSRSNTLTSIPRAASAHAAASPAIPPPTTATRGVVLGSGADGDGAGVDSARGSVTSALIAALQEIGRASWREGVEIGLGAESSQQKVDRP